jgi:creatinine amidohydrolase
MAIMSALPPRTRQWSDLTTTDFASLDLNRTIAVLPLGATEQHGPHLPLSVDANLAHSMVQAATPHLPPDLPVLFLPVQRVGYSPEHAAFAGTLSLKAETVIHLWTDIAERAGQRRAQAGAVQHPRRQHGPDGRGGARLARRLGMLVYSTSWFNLPLLEADGRTPWSAFRRPSSALACTAARSRPR